MKVYRVVGEHFYMPAHPTNIFATKAAADACALKFVNVLLDDVDLPKSEGPAEEWPQRLREAQVKRITDEGESIETLWPNPAFPPTADDLWEAAGGGVCIIEDELSDLPGDPLAVLREFREALNGIDFASASGSMEFLARLDSGIVARVDAALLDDPIAKLELRAASQPVWDELDEARRILRDLVAWADFTGGWEAPIWKAARKYLRARK
jgi:hypothetical protein